MRTQENTANRKTERRIVGGDKKLWLRRGAFVALIAAVVAVTTTVTIVGGSEPANACLIFDVIC